MWETPRVDDLLQTRLDEEIEALSADEMIYRARNGDFQRSDSPRELAQLIVSRMTSAAQSGFAAAEATLRSSAMQYLMNQKSNDLDECRNELDNLAQVFQLQEPPKDIPKVTSEMETLGFGLGAGVLLGGFSGYTAYKVLQLTVAWAFGIGFSLGTAAGLTVWNFTEANRRKEFRDKCCALVENLPVQLAKFYLLNLDEAVGAYRTRINQLAERESREKS